MPEKKPRRSAGTTTPFDVLARGFRGPSRDTVATDLHVVDAGHTVRLVCLFRATCGDYPRRFRKELIDLTSDGIVFRPSWSSLRRATFRLSEVLLDAHVRPRDLKTDRNVKAAGIFAEGQPFSYAGFEVITCRTDRGVVEFAVPRPDVPLVLHYISRIKRQNADS
jgi:hypothetical protein